MKSKDIKNAYKLWKKVGVSVVSYERENFEVDNVLRLNPTSCYVLENEKKIFGTILGAFNGRRGWIYHLAIDPAYQNKGYGSALLQKAEKALASLGATKILLGVWLYNELVLKYYQKRGFSMMDDSIILVKDIYKSK